MIRVINRHLAQFVSNKSNHDTYNHYCCKQKSTDICNTRSFALVILMVLPALLPTLSRSFYYLNNHMYTTVLDTNFVKNQIFRCDTHRHYLQKCYGYLLPRSGCFKFWARFEQMLCPESWQRSIILGLPCYYDIMQRQIRH